MCTDVWYVYVCSAAPLKDWSCNDVKLWLHELDSRFQAYTAEFGDDVNGRVLLQLCKEEGKLQQVFGMSGVLEMKIRHQLEGLLADSKISSPTSSSSSSSPAGATVSQTQFEELKASHTALQAGQAALNAKLETVESRLNAKLEAHQQQTTAQLQELRAMIQMLINHQTKST